jgi:signal transduction histidine kinase/ActR/RegA family two-component response regulator
MRQLLDLVVPETSDCAALVVVDPQETPRRVLVCRAGATGRRTTAEHEFAALPASLRQAFADALGGRVRIALHQPEPAAQAGDAELQLPAGPVFALVHGERTLGALLVAGKADTRDWPMFEELAGRAAIAFENARLYRSLQVEIEERRQAEARLRESNQRKDEFIAMLSHELRNPLAPIRSALEVIRRVAQPDPKLAWATDVSDRQVAHLTRLVEELLDVARINQGKIALHPETLDLLAVLLHSVETARPVIDARGHRLQQQLPSQTVWVRGDFARLSQVVSNLLNNAAKYTPEGGSIVLALAVEDGHARITVRDNGIGIEPELLPNVFELFEQGKRSLDRSQGGLGIGLTLVQRLVEMHNGRVEARSGGVGQGSEFIVTLPCMSEVQGRDEAGPVQAGAGVASPAACRVLVVDDNVDAADTVAMFLQIEGHVVQTAADGHQAVTSAATFQPDVVVLDIGLPQLDGYEVARRLRQIPAISGAFLIALTGYGQKGDRDLAAEAGFDCHLVKPADPRDLAERIAQWRREGSAPAEGARRVLGDSA